MLSKFYKINDAMFYFGGADDGSMKTGSQSIKDNAGDTYKFYFYTKDQSSEFKTPNNNVKGLKKGAGVVGNQSNKLYWYGLQIQADDYKYQVAEITVAGTPYRFIVNSNGTIQHSANTEYKEDGDVLIKADDAKYETTGQFKYAIESGVTSNVADVDISGFVQGK